MTWNPEDATLGPLAVETLSRRAKWLLAGGVLVASVALTVPWLLVSGSSSATLQTDITRPSARSGPSIAVRTPAPGRYRYRQQTADDVRTIDVVVTVEPPAPRAQLVRKETFAGRDLLLTETDYWSPSDVAAAEMLGGSDGDVACRWSPPLLRYVFPLQRGLRWRSTADCGRTVRRTLTAEVKSFGTTKALARSYRTAVIDITSRQPAATGLPVVRTERLWFAPELGVPVRIIYDVRQGTRVVLSSTTSTLVGFEPAT